MQQEEDDEAVYQQVFGQPREEYVEDFSPDDDQDEEISASIQQAHLKPNSRRKADRVSLMDKRYQMNPIVNNEEEKNMHDNEEGKSGNINDEYRYSSK